MILEEVHVKSIRTPRVQRVSSALKGHYMTQVDIPGQIASPLNLAFFLFAVRRWSPAWPLIYSF